MMKAPRLGKLRNGRDDGTSVKQQHRLLLGMALILAAVWIPGTASAMLTWTFDYASCKATDPVNNCNNGALSDNRTYWGSDGVSTVTVTGWANTEPGATNDELALGQITQYSGGLGITNGDICCDSGEGSAPEHAIDNDGRYELVLFDFGDLLVDLSEITEGYSPYDADVSVLAYTGNGDPTSLDGTKYSATQENLISSGWQLIGNYDIDSGGGDEVNPSDISSSYWIVAAYSPVFGTTCEPVNACYDGNDAFKISTVTGTVIEPTPPSPHQNVPEPSTALLLIGGLLFLRRRAGQNGAIDLQKRFLDCRRH